MVGRILILAFIMTGFSGCRQNEAEPSPVAAACDMSIKREWNAVYQETRKFTEEWNAVTKSCMQKRLPLSTYERGLDYRRRNNVHCVPQGIGSIWLKADGNYYDYRNGRVLIELDSATGQFRRISLGVTSDDHHAGAGRSAFSRDLGCFYVRTDQETEPVNPQDYGSQLLLDLGPNKASTEETRPSEIFRYTINGNSWLTTRYDQNHDVTYAHCPYPVVPWEHCLALRNGNPYFEPDLDAPTMAALATEALLIRSEYNFIQISKDEFDTVWNQAEENSIETSTQAFKYTPSLYVDTPEYVWDAWAEYVRGNRPAMPDAYTVHLPLVCYPAMKQIVYGDGSTGYVSGTACHDGNGGYDFQ